jgi:hypothetical protein
MSPSALRSSLLLLLYLALAACSKSGGAAPALPLAPSACEDMACLLAAAKECRPAEHVATQKVDAFGMKQQREERLVVEGRAGEGCVFTRRVEKLDVQIGPEMRKVLAEQGESDEKHKELEEHALANLKAEGRDYQRCVLPMAQLVAALEEEQRGLFRVESWSGCTYPEQRCPPPPPLGEGCILGECERGAWPVRCQADEGSVRACRIEGTVGAGVAVACTESGGLRFVALPSR